MAPSYSPRHLFLRQACRHLGLPSTTKHLLQDDDPNSNDDSVVDPGDMLLKSFYAPALTADAPYTIITTQTIDIPNDIDNNPPKEPTVTLQNTLPQTLQIFAPQYTLEEGDVHSFYPPHAHADLPSVLPHIVFSDPHLPWERGGKKYNPNLLSPQQLGPSANGGIFPDDMTRNGISVKQDNLSWTVQMTWDQLNRMKSGAVARSISDNDTDKPVDPTKTNMNIIFLNKELYTSLFAKYDPPPAGAPAGTQGSIQKTPSLDRYKYLAHYRNINTKGMAGAGVEDDGLFSVVISHRTGPLGLSAPRNVVVHLVSIDGIPENVSFPLSDDVQVGALVSLFSWNYRCLPPSNLNFVDSMTAICKPPLQMLGPPQSILDAASKWTAAGPLASKLMQDRLRLGYTLIRYRVQTGEETVAFVRGALTPVPVDRKNFPAPILPPGGSPGAITGGQWPSQSDSGIDYQILDPQLGIMDVTYSTAWQLGRSLALADTAFTTALTRYRCAAFTTALSNAKKRLLLKAGMWRAKEDTVQNLKGTVQILGRLHQNPQRRRPHPTLGEEQPSELPDLSLMSPELREAFKEELHHITARLSSGTGEHSHPLSDPAPYNEFNSPYYADWPLIQAWLLDRMHLVSVPAHHLITDPSHLPPESFRLFHIDPVWVDCLLDGALSIANHLDPTDDTIRQNIKDRLNTYLRTPINNLLPQVPISGFFLRSAIVDAMPDLQVIVPYVNTDHPGTDLLRHEIMDSGIMLVLLDRTFDDKQLQNITLAQPPHQQFYCFGQTLTPDLVELTPKKMFNDNSPQNKPSPTDPVWGSALCSPPEVTWRRDGTGNPPGGQVSNSTTNLIQVETLVETYRTLLNTNMKNIKGWMEEKEGSSAMLAFELNATNFYAVTVNPTLPPKPTAVSTADTTLYPFGQTVKRQIYLGEPRNSNKVESERSSRDGQTTPIITPPSAALTPSSQDIIFHKTSSSSSSSPSSQTKPVVAPDVGPHFPVARKLPAHGPAVPSLGSHSKLLQPLPSRSRSNATPYVTLPPRTSFALGGIVDDYHVGTFTRGRYSFTVFPSYLLKTIPKGQLPATSTIPTDANQKIDIAVGINLVDRTPPTSNPKDLHFLKDIEVAMPIRPRPPKGQESSDPAAPIALTYTDYAERGSVLSNGRWVVKTTVVDAEQYALSKHVDHPARKLYLKSGQSGLDQADGGNGSQKCGIVGVATAAAGTTGNSPMISTTTTTTTTTNTTTITTGDATTTTTTTTTTTITTTGGAGPVGGSPASGGTKGADGTNVAGISGGSQSTTPAKATLLLLCRLIPKSIYNMVYYTENTSCSFLLPLVTVDPYIPASTSAGADSASATNPTVSMDVTCTECYLLYQDGHPQALQYTHGGTVTVKKGVVGYKG
ncbi:hypothetical protein CNMCM5793_006131 [Aspergillus hiratsukae]|uniref:Uncharacterized protein n=1 Tax=Aspergillus hiratsukae TaxID=1194566 RepID=A0A8H6QGE2_9EURO|nr:hypothetical protein CNMCM5793_006131 [Aspergillus hiratsukae]KAF7172601.1 hypothetical protein CNMCM6106_006766 [Aspergillus hiratsukae]